MGESEGPSDVTRILLSRIHQSADVGHSIFYKTMGKLIPLTLLQGWLEWKLAGEPDLNYVGQGKSRMDFEEGLGLPNCDDRCAAESALCKLQRDEYP